MKRLIGLMTAASLLGCSPEPPDRSALMRTRLAELRAGIAAYTKKNHHGPHTLADLVKDCELPAVPVDPVTRSATTWKIVSEEVVRNDDFARTAAALPPDAIIEVHSGAPGADARGKRWSEY